MSKNKVKILVACHKPDTIFQNEVYIPIHVGRSVSKFKKEMADMIGDDTGENISSKNPFYCELTAQYWAWKNLDCEYIGLCHYRRYFEQKVTEDNIDHLLGDNYDAMCIQRIYDVNSSSTRLIMASSLDDFQIFMYALKIVSPQMLEYAKIFLKKGEITPYNMFVMKKQLFSDFAEWQFAVLAEMEKHIRLSGYSRARRIYGYYAEMMLPIYLGYNKRKIRYSPCVRMVGDCSKREFLTKLRTLYLKFLNKLCNTPIMYDIDAVIVGFKADGINVGYIDKIND